MRTLFGAGAGGGEIAIREAFFENAPGHFAMQIAAVGLAVLFVPVEIEPLEAFEDGVERGLGVAVDVGIVDAQHHYAVMMAGVEPIKNERPGAADVQETGSRGRETHTSHEFSGYRSVYAVRNLRDAAEPVGLLWAYESIEQRCGDGGVEEILQ